MKALAVITARGGSKRIPRKNIKPFLGKPIIEYSIEAALKSGLFEEVMVSTDDEEIAEVAKKAGASVPFYRSPETANDYATTADVLVEVLETYKELGRDFDFICCLYPTAPFVTEDAIKTAMETLEAKDADTVMPVVKFSFPPQRCVTVKEGCLVAKWPEYMLSRSQDLEPLYHDCGQFYCLNTKQFLKQRKIIMEKTMPYFQEEINVQDIDTEEDWELAELKYQRLRGKKHGE
jgi:N-acylneuraminate cytidylyltransferase